MHTLFSDRRTRLSLRPFRPITASIILPSCFLASPLHAQLTGDVILNASIDDSCLVAISTAGTMTPNTELTQMSSELSGGARERRCDDRQPQFYGHG